MATCLIIKESDLEESVRMLHDKNFVYKFMYDTSNRDDYHEDYLGITKITDCNIFSQSINQIKSLKFKKNGREIDKSLKEMAATLFENERQYVLINDYNKYKNLVIVFGNKYTDKSSSSSEMHLSISDENLDIFFNEFIQRMYNQEGMRMYTIEDYKSGLRIDSEKDFRKFIERQQDLVSEDQLKFKKDIKRMFDESFKFRLITYYTKLKEFSLEEIMDQLWSMGYLDSSYSNECFIYEDLARQYLARRLCTISFKDDIEVLIKKGIIDKSAIKYDIGLKE